MYTVCVMVNFRVEEGKGMGWLACRFPFLIPASLGFGEKIYQGLLPDGSEACCITRLEEAV